MNGEPIRMGLGCMRLSTSPSRDADAAIQVIHAALAAGVRLLDTANVYCRDERDVGHNERLVARALAEWTGPRSPVEVATKGGLTRVGRRWVPDGRAKQLIAACEASRAALGVETIDSYQLHAVDPRTPLETSVRTLSRLLDQGVIRAIGVCNVTVGQLEIARRIAPISTVQAEVQPYGDTNLRNGIAEYCRYHGIRLIAARPFGGDRHARLGRDPVLRQIATRHGVSEYQVVLAWLLSLHPGIVPIPGATRPATITELRGATQLVLTAGDIRSLDERFPAGRIMRVPRAARRPADGADGDVVLLMGAPGAGKSTLARRLEAEGYGRLNRDTHGGRVADLAPMLDAGIRAGRRRWVLDNTFPARAVRNLFVETAWVHGVPVRCVWLTTSKEDAQINAVTRLVRRYGRLPSPDELRALSKRDPAAFGPAALFRYERELEPPVADEGFARIDAAPFVRDPDAADGAPAIMLEYDGVLVAVPNGGDVVMEPDDIVLLPGRREALCRYYDRGWKILVTAWRPQVSRGNATEEAVTACFARTSQLLDLDVEFRFCPHDAGPPVCWCRKPLPGIPVEFALLNEVNLSDSLWVGRSAADRTLAERLGMSYHEAIEFF